MISTLSTASVPSTQTNSFFDYVLAAVIFIGVWAIAIFTRFPAAREKILGRFFKKKDGPSGRDRKYFDQDFQDPLRRWARCVFAMQTGYSDDGYLSASDAKKEQNVISWGITNKESFEHVLSTLDDSDNNAPDLVRYIYFSRLGAALGFISQEESWKRILPMCERLQKRYRSFEEIGNEYRTARIKWLGLDPAKAAQNEMMKFFAEVYAWLRKDVWSQVPFTSPLA